MARAHLGLMCLLAAGCGGGSTGTTTDATSAIVDAAPAADAGPDAAPVIDDSAYLFDLTQVRELRLEIPEASWGPIDAEAVPGEPTCRTEVWERSYYAGALEFEGERFDGVGLRVKGGCGTSRHLDQKASFLVNLEWDDPAVEGCPARRRLHGQKHFTLNNLVQDASYLHETMGYGLYRQLGVPASRTAYYQLYVNDAYFGLYLLLETVDRQLLDRWFVDEDGMMYENGRPYCDLVPGNVGDGGCFTQEFHDGPCGAAGPGEDPRDWTLLEDLTTRLESAPYGDGFLPAFGQIFDVDEYLGTWAMSGAIRHVDSANTGTNNNYRVYHQPSNDRWYLLQAGLDYSMYVDPYEVIWEANSVISQKCLSDAACTAAYAAKVRAARDVMADPTLVAEATRIHAMIWPYIHTDPRREYIYDPHQGPYTTDAEFYAAYTWLVGWFADRPAEIDAVLAQWGF